MPDGPLALEASWNASTVARCILAEGIGAKASHHAGTFACNAALFLTLRNAPPGTAVGFLHVPHLGWPVGPRIGRLVRAVEIALDALRGSHPAR